MYVEVDPERGTVVRVLLPLPTRVVRIEERDDELLLELAGSHAVHLVDLRGADADELSSSLRAAHESRGGILVIEDESHQVMDVMEFTPAPDGPVLPPFPQLPVPELLIPRPPFWRRLWDWFWDWLLWWWRCPSAAAAQTIFDQLGATTCPPLTVPAPCIPFMYPDNGCWARAHEMCRLMLALGRAPRKVWIKEGPQGPLRVNTKNNPNCHVQWWYHVAPTLCVRTGSIWWWPFITERMVIDPSMFTMPVPLGTWQTACTDPTSTLEHTGSEQYGPYGGTDASYTSTNADLASYRTALLNRSLGASGPPPYSHC